MTVELAVVMPVYNESEAIGPVLDKWLQALRVLKINFQIHAYNDGSKDTTLNVLQKYAAVNTEVVVHDKKNSGHGPTILLGYRENSVAQWIFQIDSDDELGPIEFNQLWQLREAHDFVIGIRTGRRSPLARTLITAISRIVVCLFYGRGVTDVNAPYRLYRTSSFAEYFKKIPMTTFAPNVVLSGLAALKKLRIAELPVQYKDRTTGEVSIKKWRLFKAACKSFAQTISLRFTF